MRVKKYGLWLRRRDADPAGSLPSAEARAATQVAEHRDRPKAAPSSSFGDSPRVHTLSARRLVPASRELLGRSRSVRPAMRCQGSGHTSRQHGTDPKRRPRRRVRPSPPPPPPFVLRGSPSSPLSWCHSNPHVGTMGVETAPRLPSPGVEQSCNSSNTPLGPPDTPGLLPPGRGRCSDCGLTSGPPCTVGSGPPDGARPVSQF